MVKLFGGAIDCKLPDDFNDASEYRDVPDNQEMYVGEVDGYDSGFIVELCEMVAPGKDLELAFHEHLKDIHNAADMDLDKVDTIEYIKETVHGRPYMGTVQSIKDPRKGATLLLFALIRLEKFDTDVVITQSIVVGENALAAPAMSSLIAQAKTNVATCANSFEVLDPTLFNTE